MFVLTGDSGFRSDEIVRVIAHISESSLVQLVVPEALGSKAEGPLARVRSYPGGRFNALTGLKDDLDCRNQVRVGGHEHGDVVVVVSSAEGDVEGHQNIDTLLLSAPIRRAAERSGNRLVTEWASLDGHEWQLAPSGYLAGEGRLKIRVALRAGLASVHGDSGQLAVRVNFFAELIEQ